MIEIVEILGEGSTLIIFIDRPINFVVRANLFVNVKLATRSQALKPHRNATEICMN